MRLFSQIRKKVTRYFEVRMDLFKLEFIQRSSIILSYLIFSFLCLCISLPLFFFLGLALAEYLNELTGSRSVAFLLTSGIYVLIFILIFLFRVRIIRSFAGIFINVMTEDDPNEEIIEEEEQEED